MNYIYLFLILYFLITAAALREVPVSKFFNMKSGYLLIILFFGTTVIAQESAIKRASLSTAPSTTQGVNFLVQQSVGFMGAMQTQSHENINVTQGFLIPQGVAVETLPTQMEWSLYPNPFSTHINIEFSQAVSGTMQIILFDVTGQLVYNRTHEAKQRQRIPFETLAQGEYIIQVKLMNQSFSTQLINYSTEHRNQ